MNNFVLRGCTLRNTKWVLGLVSYTGHDTKVMQNNFKARAKKSQLENTMESQIKMVFSIQMFICFFASIYYTAWYNNNSGALSYLAIDQNSVTNDEIITACNTCTLILLSLLQAKDNSDSYNFFVRLGNWILIFTNFVPICMQRLHFRVRDSWT